MSPRATARLEFLTTTRGRRAGVRRCATLIAVAAGALSGSAGVAVAAPGGPVATVAGGAVRGAADAGGFAFLGLPYAAPPTGQPALARRRSRRPRGAASATRRSSRRAARSCRARSRRPPRSPRTACTSTSTRRRCIETPIGRCSCGSTAAGSPRTARATTTAPSSRRRARSWSRSNYRLGALGVPRPSRARRAAGRPGRQLRPDGPDRGPALGPAQHRAVRRGPAQRHDRGPVRRRRLGARPARLA